MPIARYFKGSGNKVMKKLKSEYGKKGESIFYALANKEGMNPKKKKGKK